jgi:hypothetical protein
MDIDNFDQINSYLTFNSDDDYYHLQILKRKKENPEMKSNNILMCTYYIKSNEQLMKMKNDIVAICKATNARAYLNLNTKSFKRSSLDMLQQLAVNIASDQYRSHKLFNRASGRVNSPTNNKTWILDIDDHDWLDNNMQNLERILNICEPINVNKIIGIVKTKNGKHVITKPFNQHTWGRATADLAAEDDGWGFDIQKNNPTILFVPSQPDDK